MGFYLNKVFRVNNRYSIEKSIMKCQILILLLVATLAMVSAHNPNKKNKLKKFGCFAQCKDECTDVMKFKKACFIPCKKQCDKGDKECKKACRTATCESPAAEGINVDEARSQCKECKIRCRPIMKKCWEDNCTTECPTKRSKKQKDCKVCLKTNCGGLLEEDEEEDELLE